MKNYYKAIAGFQQECPVLLKSTSGYGYTYVDLPSIIHKINPLLSKHGLGFSQTLGTNPETNNSCLETHIFHPTSGEYHTSMVDIPMVTMKGMNAYQSFGSGLTYFRRYALTSALGIVSDKDLDAYGEQETPEKKTNLGEVQTNVMVDLADADWAEVLIKIKARRDRGESWATIIKALKGKFNVTVEEEKLLKKSSK
mgnify:FL=1|tara:strand:+ start:3261 stop:3851 length:591 start_codon:yes stop_codon:yes gene_type:complete